MSETANTVLLSILATEAMQRQVQSGLDKVDRNATEQDLRQVITNLRTVNEKLVADYNLLVEKHNGLVESYNTLREEALAKKESRTRQNSQIDKLIQAMFAGYRLLGFKGLAKAYIADLALRYSDLARRHDEPVPTDIETILRINGSEEARHQAVSRALEQWLRDDPRNRLIAADLDHPRHSMPEKAFKAGLLDDHTAGSTDDRLGSAVDKFGSNSQDAVKRAARNPDSDLTIQPSLDALG